MLLHYVVAATFYYLFFSPIFTFPNGFEIPLWLHNLLFYLITPIAAGLTLCKLDKVDILEKSLKFLRIPVNVPIDDAWDYMFGKKLGSGVYVIITLKTGEYIYGYVGPSSLAGNTPGRRDIFIETIFELNEAEEWVEVQPKRSIYIGRDQIKYMEVLNG